MNVKNVRLKTCVCAVLAAAAVGGDALAAEEKITQLEEIVVTAQKREESLQEVPIAISAYTSEARDELGIITLQDFTDFTPGITYSTQLDRMTVRGIGRQTNNLATSASVATYGDGFYNSSNHQADSSTMFTERVEVLRGPQGTLYGRNSIGGALNVMLKRPKDDWGGEVRAIGGSYGRKELEGTLTGPITDFLRFRVGAGNYRQDEGYIENLPTDDDGYGQRNDKYALLMLEANIGDALDLFFKYTYSEWDQGYGTSVTKTPYVTTRTCVPTGASGSPSFPTATTCRASLVATGSLGPSALYNTGTGLNPAVPQYLTPNPGVEDSRKRNQDTSSHNFLDPDHIFVLEAVGHLSFADLKYVGGYHEYVYTLNSDFDNSDRFSFQYTGPAAGDAGCSPTTCNNTPVTLYSQVISTYIEDKSYYSNEINLISTGDGALQWVGGLYQYHESYKQPVDTFNPNQTQLFTPQLGPSNPHGTYQFTDAHTKIDSLAVFGQLDWKFVDTLEATIGLRYTEDKKSGDEFIRRVSWNPTFLGPFAPAFDITGLGTASGGFNSPTTIGGGLATDGSGNWTRSFEHKWHATTGTAGLAWQPFDGANGYLKYTRGYKDGGVNAGNMVALADLYTNPEFVDAYEAGWKQDIGGRFTANLSVFYYDYNDAQFPLTLVSDVGTSSQIFNIDSISRGAELETVWLPIDSLQLRLGYAYLKTHIKDERCFVDAISIPGVPLFKQCGPQLATGSAEYVKGNELPGAPRNKVSANVVYTLSFDPGSLALSGSYVWRSEQYSAIFSRPEWQVPGYDKIDLRAIWTAASNMYSVVAYARNLTDEEGYDGVAATATAGAVTQTYSLTPPRTYGLELQFRFGSAQ